MNGGWGERSTTKWIASTLQMFSCTVPPLNCGHSSASFLRGITTGEHRIECCVMLRFFHFILRFCYPTSPINPPLIETNVRSGEGGTPPSKSLLKTCFDKIFEIPPPPLFFLISFYSKFYLLIFFSFFCKLAEYRPLLSFSFSLRSF